MRGRAFLSNVSTQLKISHGYTSNFRNRAGRFLLESGISKKEHAAMAGVSSDVAVDYIQERILKGEYPMGYALNTRILAAEIGISRTPVREALRRLEAKGLVEIVPHFGANVRSLQLGEFIEMC